MKFFICLETPGLIQAHFGAKKGGKEQESAIKPAF
jgi:hypothetical protein